MMTREAFVRGTIDERKSEVFFIKQTGCVEVNIISLVKIILYQNSFVLKG